jgi:hypothetical protein
LERELIPFFWLRRSSACADENTLSLRGAQWATRQSHANLNPTVILSVAKNPSSLLRKKRVPRMGAIAQERDGNGDPSAWVKLAIDFEGIKPQDDKGEVFGLPCSFQ